MRARARTGTPPVLSGAFPRRARASTELKADDFELPAFRTIFEALASLSDQDDVNTIAEVLPENCAPVFQALRNAAAAMQGIDLDREYEGAAVNLRDRAEFRRVYRIQDPSEKQRIMKSWTPEQQKRWAWQIAQTKNRRARRQ